jgi:hypothetical protein
MQRRRSDDPECDELNFETPSNSGVAHDVTQRWRTMRRNDTLAACMMWRNDARAMMSKDVATMWRNADATQRSIRGGPHFETPNSGVAYARRGVRCDATTWRTM